VKWKHLPRKHRRYSPSSPATRSLPRWANEDYQGDEQDFTGWLKAGVRQALLQGRLARVHDPEALARIEAQVNHMVMSKTKAIQGKTERAFLFQVYEANRTGWFRHLPAEMDTIEELLASIVDAASKDGSLTEISNLTFLAKTAIPLLKENGVKPEDVWGIPFLTGKAAAIVPGLREIMRCPECGLKTKHDGTTCFNGHPLKLTDQQKQAAVELTRMVADERTSAEDIRTRIALIRGRVSRTLQPIPKGEVYIIPGGQEWILLRSPSPEHTRAIEIALGRIVSDGLHYSDLVTLIQSLNNQLSGVSMDAPVDVSLPW
jgi:hypothetical protein